MALTKSVQVPYPSATLSPGAGTVNGSGGWLAVGYGATINLLVTNGATGPTTGAQVIVEVAEDSSGTNPREVWRGVQGDTTANAVNYWPYCLGVGGSGGDHSHYRVSFVAPTGQAVTVSARAMSTTAF